MKKDRIIISGILIFSILFISAFKLSAQESPTGVKRLYDKGIDEKLPIPYTHLREADVMWSKKIWRTIDLRQKMNQPLYYPTTPIGDRKNLITIILEKIRSGEISAFDADVDPGGNDLTVKITQADIDEKMGAGVDSTTIPLGQGRYKDTVIFNEPKPEEIKQFQVKEEWYFDRKKSRMEVRIIGLMPIRFYYDEELSEYNKTRVCWIYYPDFRKAFANHEVYNPNNDAHRISFDDYFMQRRFSGTIIAESNVYANRTVTDYETGKAALLEAKRIKEALFNFEHDLWEY